MARSHARAIVAVALVVALPLGCRQILGIEERELDASLVDAGSDAGELSCETYCTKIMDACTGTHLQYATKEACLALCPTFPVGALTDQGTNSLGCRIREVESIELGGEVASCTGAGPGGEATCGTTNCEAYCASLKALCPTQYETLGNSDTACLAACAQVPDCGGYQADAERNDDSMQCRLFHLTSAAIDAIEHCPHTIGDNGKCTPSDAGTSCDAGQ